MKECEGMKNPFKNNGYMLPIASINSVYIDDQLVGDLFRLELIVQDCLMHKDALKLSNVSNHRAIFDGFQSALLSDDKEVNDVALYIAHKYGQRLAQMLLTLKKPTKLSMDNRSDWNKSHWDYWKSVEKVIFVGGVAIPALIKIFLQDIKEVLYREQIALEISFIEGSINLGTEALTKSIKDGDALLFDFGQTNIKRRHYSKNKGDMIFDMILPCLPSKYLFYKNQDTSELLNNAKKLDLYIQKVITDTIEETMFEGNVLYLAIANYVYKGHIYPNRGGYAKLSMIEDEYERYLSAQLSERCGKLMEVKLIHDTTAVSRVFENEHNTAVISIGTAFGIAFIDD